jgi:hypothetical protein
VGSGRVGNSDNRANSAQFQVKLPTGAELGNIHDYNYSVTGYGAQTNLWCTHYARISYTAVHLYCSPVSVHSGTVLLCIQMHCITVHSLVPDWFLFCQSIAEELQFTCFALIGPLSIITPIPPSHQLNHSMLTTSFPKGNGRGKIVLKVLHNTREINVWHTLLMEM